MRFSNLWIAPILLTLWPVVHGQDTGKALLPALTACASIQEQISSGSEVYYPRETF